MTTIIGIDPGLDGAIACLIDNELLAVEDMPTFTEQRGKKKHRTVNAAGVADIIREMARANLETPTVAIERVWSSPDMGVASAFTFGHGFGIVEAVPLTLGYPIRLVTPNVWKKALGLTSDKERSRRMATETWPAYSEWFRRVKDADRAEAALIALYVAQEMAGGQRAGTS